MLTRIFIRSKNLTPCFLQKISDSLKFSKLNFSNGRKVKPKSKNSKTEGNNHAKIKERMETMKKERNKEVEIEGREISFSTYGLVILFFGATQVAHEIYICKDLKKFSYNEFENQYLLHGEVREVKFVSFFGSTISKTNAIAYLHHDANRKYQEICIINEIPEEIKARISQKENELKIQKKDAISLKYSFNDMIIYVGLSFLMLRYIEWRSKKNFSRIKAYKEVKEEKEMKIFKKTMNETRMKEVWKERNLNISPEKEVFRAKADIKFKDIAGLHSAKVEVQEFLQYLNNPYKFVQLGARLPKGAILLGPPGCGKTLLVKALANEAEVPFYYKSGPDFIDMGAGNGALHIRKLFKDARSDAPSIIFIDEIDAIGKTRGGHMDMGDSDGDQTLNQLLVEMDGMDTIAGVIVFAATNRADILDKALIRPGRFDRHILIDYPVLEERKELFNLYLTKNKRNLEGSIQTLTNRLALQTPGMSGADIANICNEAAVAASRMNYDKIKDDCFDMALERVIAGAASKTKFLSTSERKINAYHEAGHVLVGWMLKYADPIIKVSIVPRTMGILGFRQIDNQNKYLRHYDMLVDEIAVLLGGRAAESIIFKSVTSGAENDLKKVTKLAFRMVREWGMSEKVGHFNFEISEENVNRGQYPYSKLTQALIEMEANNIVVSAYKKAESLIKENIEKLEKIASELLKKEELVYEEVENLIGPRPFVKKL